MVTYKRLGSNGELGNQLFQIAATIGYSRKTKIPYTLPPWVNYFTGEKYSDYFIGNIIQSDSITSNFHTYTEPNFHYTDIPTNLGEYVNLMGYFQSEKYFINCSDEIKQLFKPSLYILNKISTLKFDNTICIQLRFYDNSRPYGTNQVNLDAGSYLYHNPYTNKDFLIKSINYFGKNKTYLVVTNNSQKARKMLGVYDNFIFLDDYNYIEQFFIQTMSEHNIISNSSFGWWGAYLNDNTDKKVFAPKKWFTVEDGYDTKDLYPEGWNII